MCLAGKVVLKFIRFVFSCTSVFLLCFLLDRCLVIDEADRMVEKGHFLELSQLLEILNDSQYNPQRQTFVFSATLTLVHQTPTRVLQKKNAKKMDKKTKLELLMEKVGIKGKPKVIDLTRKEATVETLTETRIHCNTNEKDYYLYYFLLQYPGRTMVFANSIDCVKRLSSLLTILNCDPLPLHANMHQKQRLKNLERFAERERWVDFQLPSREKKEIAWRVMVRGNNSVRIGAGCGSSLRVRVPCSWAQDIND